LSDTEGLGDDNGDFIPGVGGVGVGLPVAGINVGTFVGNSVSAGEYGADEDGVAATVGAMVGDEVTGARVGALVTGAGVTGAAVDGLAVTGAEVGEEVTPTLGAGVTDVKTGVAEGTTVGRAKGDTGAEGTGAVTGAVG